MFHSSVMTKYTFSKLFSQDFPHIIWKIVADPIAKRLGIELRQPDSTLPLFYSLDFSGNTIHRAIAVSAKEWTLDAIRADKLILKKVGDYQPVKEGVRVLDLQGNSLFSSEEHILLHSEPDYLQLRHRSFQSGFEQYVDLTDFRMSSQKPSLHAQEEPAINIPVPYYGELPDYLKTVTRVDGLWLSRWEDKFIWTYHRKEKENYALILCLADESELLYSTVLLEDMPKMIPQPYFQIGNQIFLLSYNKQEIVSYLL